MAGLQLICIPKGFLLSIGGMERRAKPRIIGCTSLWHLLPHTGRSEIYLTFAPSTRLSIVVTAAI